MAGHDGYTRYTMRIPDDLYERIKEAAGEKSINAEILAVLHKAYPPKTLDVRVLSNFLEGLAGVSAPDGNHEYLEAIEKAFKDAGFEWSIKSGWDGAVTFYPYGPMPKSPKKKIDPE